MIVLVAGADGRLGRVLVPLLVASGHVVRALVRTGEHVGALEAQGATPLVADLRGDVEWAVDGCDATIFAAGARRRTDFGAIDGGGAAKLAEAAHRFELRRFVLCSAIGAGEPERRRAPLRDFLAAKQFAERRLQQLNVPWTILRFGGLTRGPGTGRITTTVDGRRSRRSAEMTLRSRWSRRWAVRIWRIASSSSSKVTDASPTRSLPSSRRRCRRSATRALARLRRRTRRRTRPCCSRTRGHWTPTSTTRATGRWHPR